MSSLFVILHPDQNLYLDHYFCSMEIPDKIMPEVAKWILLGYDIQ